MNLGGIFRLERRIFAYISDYGRFFDRFEAGKVRLLLNLSSSTTNFGGNKKLFHGHEQTGTISLHSSDNDSSKIEINFYPLYILWRVPFYLASKKIRIISFASLLHVIRSSGVIFHSVMAVHSSRTSLEKKEAQNAVHDILE